MTALVVGGTAFGVTATSTTVSYTVGSGSNRCLVFQDKTNGGNYVSSVRFNGVDLTELAHTDSFLVFWYLLNPPTGANNLVVNLNAAAGNGQCVLTELTGVNQTTPFGTYVKAEGLSQYPETPSVICPAGGLVFGGAHLIDVSGGLAAGAGTTVQTNFGDTASSKTIADGWRADSGVLQWGNQGPTTWTAHAVPVNPVAGGPTAPGSPTIGTATAGNLSASVTFTPPASNGGATITGYTATSSPGGFTGTSASSPINVAGLTAGTPYTFTVTAANSANTSAPSAASNSVTPTSAATLPGAPTIGALTNNGDGTLTIAGTAPASNGGSAITRYIALSSSGNVEARAAALPIIIANVNLVSQTVTLKAENSAGIGAASAASNAVTPTTGSGGSNIPVNPGAAGTVTLPVFKNDSVIAQTNLSITSLLVQTLSGITVATFGPLTANSSAILAGQTHANIIIGTVYRTVGYDSAGNEFRNKVTAT